MTALAGRAFVFARACGKPWYLHVVKMWKKLGFPQALLQPFPRPHHSRDAEGPSNITQKGITMEHKEITQIDWSDDTGATTAEYAITTLAACGFAAVLVVLLKSEPVNNMLLNIVQLALGMGQ